MKSIKRTLLFTVVAALVACGPPRANRIVIGSKNFTEQAVLGEIFAQQIESRTNLQVERRFYLAGSFLCHQAMLAGRIDIYPEYTGTALTAILKEKPGDSRQEVFARVKSEYESKFNFTIGPPLGFDDTFAIEIRGEDARRLHLKTISEAATYTPQWRPGFGYEFMERPDGYKGLVAAYDLHFVAPPRIMDLGLLTRALKEKQVDLVAGNTTDGLIPALDLFVLQDDRNYFPPYEAVAVMRRQMLALHPEVANALDELAGKISEQEMQQLNYTVDGKHGDIKIVVQDFLRKKNLAGTRASNSRRRKHQLQWQTHAES